MSKKELKKEALENANGGAGYGMKVECESCHEYFNFYGIELRDVGSGCDKKTEAKCPNCGHWNEY